MEREISALGGYQFVAIGNTLDVPIMINDITDLRALDLIVFYDPNALEMVGEASLGSMFELGKPSETVGDWALVQNLVRPGYLRLAAYTAKGELVGPQELVLLPFKGLLVIPDLPQVYTPVRVDAILWVGATQQNTERIDERTTVAVKVQPRKNGRQSFAFPGDPT